MRKFSHFLCVYALWFFTTLFISTNALTQGIYIPNDTYPLSDYQEYGMVFEMPHQRTINALTKQLLEAERQNSHWAGARQEDVIRSKVKKYYALAQGVFPGKAGVDRSEGERAVKQTNSALFRWYEEHVSMVDPKLMKERARQNYNEAVRLVQSIQEGKNVKQREASERARIETAERAHAKAEWEKKAYEQYDRENAQRASEDKERACAKRCRERYWDLEISYYRCYNLCKEHDKPKAEPIRHP